MVRILQKAISGGKKSIQLENASALFQKKKPAALPALKKALRHPKMEKTEIGFGSEINKGEVKVSFKFQVLKV